MFGEFEQGAKKTEDCQADCTHRYLLQVKYWIYEYYTVDSIQDEPIITSMKLFYYQSIHISYGGNTIYEGSIFTGV